MEKRGIKEQGLSHTQIMENKIENKTQTKDDVQNGLLISPTDAEEFRAYKRQKKIGEVMTAIARSASQIDGKADAVRITERAARLRQAAVKMAPTKFMQTREYLTKSHVKIDMIIGGDGEILPKVKAYEAKLAKRLGANELTVVATPSLVENCRYGEVKKELKRIARVAKSVCFKVWVDKSHPFTTISRMARISAEVGAKYFCVPYFAGCERLRYDLPFGCLLEVSEVETLADFKKMAGAGMGRIVTRHIMEIHGEWMKEIETERVFTAQEPIVEKKSPPAVLPKIPAPALSQKQAEIHALIPPAAIEKYGEAGQKQPETFLKGSDLKFL